MVKDNDTCSMDCWICRNWIHGKVIRVTSRIATQFKCRKHKGGHRNTDLTKKLHDYVEMMTVFTCRGENECRRKQLSYIEPDWNGNG